MCLAAVFRIEDIIDKEFAWASVGGVKKKINIAFFDDLKIGDFVLVHAGFAIQRIAKKDLKEFFLQNNF